MKKKLEVIVEGAENALDMEQVPFYKADNVCAHCGGHVEPGSWVERDGKKFCSPLCANS